MAGLLAQLAFIVATAVTPHCHAGDVANCHYSVAHRGVVAHADTKRLQEMFR